MTDPAPKRIVIVDDSKYIRTFVNSVLSNAGYQVTAVEPSSIFDVLSAIVEAKPDLVITDYEMPECNGESLLRLMREDWTFREVPVMVFSAHGEKELVERLSAWDLTGYLLKPIRPEELVRKVDEQLRMIHQRQALQRKPTAD